MPRGNKYLKALTVRMNHALEARRAAEAEIRLIETLLELCQPAPRKKPAKPTLTPIETRKVT